MSWKCSLTDPLLNRNKPKSWDQSQGHLLTKPQVWVCLRLLLRHSLVFNTQVVPYIMSTDPLSIIRADLGHLLPFEFWLLIERVVS